MVATRSHLRVEELVGAMLEQIALGTPTPIHLEVLLPVVLPPTLPISAVPLRIATRLGVLRDSARDVLATSGVPGAVAVVRCRSLRALLCAVEPVDRLVLVGGAGWSVRRAAKIAASDVVVVSTRSGRRGRAATSPRPAIEQRAR
jgi:hypothetical protein